MKHHTYLRILGLTLLTFCLKSQNIWAPTSGPNGLNAQYLTKTVDNRLVLSATQSGIFISKDYGNTWKKVSKGLPDESSYAYHLASAPDSSIYAIVVTEIAVQPTELYRLDYGVDEWIKLKGNLSTRVTVVATELGSIFLVGSGKAAILFSYDRGINFDTIYSNPFTNIGPYAINGNNQNYFTVDEGTSPHAIYKINDNGDNLSLVYRGEVHNLLYHPTGFLLINNLIYDSYRIDHLDNVEKLKFPETIVNPLFLTPDFKIMAMGTDSDYISDDFGTSWSKTNTNLRERVNGGVILYIKDTLFNMTTGCYGTELSKTGDFGKNWISMDDKFENPDHKDLFIDLSGNLFSKTCYNSYSISSDDAKHWSALMPVSGTSNYDLVSLKNGNWFARTRNGLFKSTDKGLNWIEINHFGNNEFRKLASDGDKIIYMFGSNSSLVSTDAGENWNLISSPPVIEVSEVYFHPDGFVYLLDKNPTAPYIVISQDNGKSWTNVDHDFAFIIGLWFSKNGNIYIRGQIKGSTYALYESTDKLKTLNKLAEKTFNELVIDDQNVMYGIINGGSVERSKNGGIDWEPFSTGLPDKKIVSLALDKNQYLYAGVAFDKVYKTIDPVAVPSGSVETINEKGIMIYPNPAMNKVSIKLPGQLLNNKTKWFLCDLTGRLVLTDKTESNHFSFDTENVPDGVYFFRISQSDILPEKVVIQH